MKQTVSSPRRLELPRNAAEWLEAIMNFLFFLCGILAVGCVVLISAYMVISGVPAIRQIGLFRFLFGTEWASTAADPKFGILPFLLSSIYGTLGATLIGVPVGLLTAVFLSKAAGPRVRAVVVTAIELLSGIPSVVFGLLGMQVLVPFQPVWGGAEKVAAGLAEYYRDAATIKVHALNEPLPENGLYSNAMAGTDRMELYSTVNAAGDQMMLVSLFDNLGKGSSGAAVQCMNLMLGFEETEGLE